MKISVLIPVYNFNVKNLVQELDAQCESASDLKDYEILLYDDKSSDTFQNSELTNSRIAYKEFPKNLGRSKIRNQLALDAKFDVILFLDCDSRIDKPDFIKAYVQHYQDNSVVYGGRTYDQNEPENPDLFLRWKYGMEREIIPADIRIKNPYQSFMTNNFLMTKSIFLRFKLDENLSGYGHEDTLFGIELRENQIPIVHIDNPAVHIGLEGTDEFLVKTKEGIKNLYRLYAQKKLKNSDVKLLGYYAKFKLFPLKQFFNLYYRKRENKIVENLKSKEVKIHNFDFYKLYTILNQ